MLGLLMACFVARSFWRLAERHGYNRGAFAIFGMATYYAMGFLGGIAIFLIALVFGFEYIFDDDGVVLSIMAMPVGLLSVWVLHFALRKKLEGGPKGREMLGDGNS